ncbi:radical SAM protein [Selenomonas ruminantium]|uniref:radical SAM protein n=1 Tax=Selenomonas ruminantium TaxID=971 RepID=UPI00047ABD61|nr:radical SAM protein [Selenomonas ruminantium]
MRTDLGKLTDDWKGITSIVPYGAGIVGNICKTLFEQVDLTIPFVIDNDKTKQGKKWRGRPIISFEEAKPQLGTQKIVVMAGHDAYGKITRYLNAYGFVEFEDFCNVGHFMSEWLWDAKRMNCVFHVDMTITTKCTLNCRHCNLFIPYHKTHVNFSFEELKHSIDLFFERIDFVTYFGLIGGETFLHPELEQCIEYLGENYKNKIGRITIVTNGTVRPSDSLLNIIKKYEMYLSISDYTNVVPYGSKMNELVRRAEEYGIDFSRNASIVWTDFGFPNHPLKRTPEELENHLKSCRPNWNALHGGRFYYCNVSWCAEQSGRFRLLPDDSIALADIDSKDKVACRKIVELSRGTSSFCRICGGCGKDNTKFVETGRQLP